MKELQLTADHTRFLEKYKIPLGNINGVKAIRYEKGEFICNEGQPIPNLLFVFEGKAKVCFQTESGKSLLLCFYQTGGIIGELELMLSDSAARTSVQAISVVRCIGIPVIQNRGTLLSNKDFLSCIGITLARKLERCTQNSANIILNTLEARLCSYIEVMNRDGLFQDKLTDTAELLGISYRHLLRVLEKLCMQGILKKRERGYFILDLAALRENGRGFYKPVEKQIQ